MTTASTVSDALVSEGISDRGKFGRLITRLATTIAELLVTAGPSSFAFAEDNAVDVPLAPAGFATLQSITMTVAVGDRIELLGIVQAAILVGPSEVDIRLMAAGVEVRRIQTDGTNPALQEGAVGFVVTPGAAGPMTFLLQAQMAQAATTGRVGPASVFSSSLLTVKNHGPALA